MLAASVVHEIRHLLAATDLSHRKIATRLGVSRGTVSAIASGRRGFHGRIAADDELRHLPSASPPARCPKCGYRIYKPCLVCIAREHQGREHGGREHQGCGQAIAGELAGTATVAARAVGSALGPRDARVA